MNDITFGILKIIVSICAAISTVYLIPYLKTLKEDKRYAALVSMVEVAVRAAEQTFSDKQGAAKREEVMKFVQYWMDKQGIKISYEQLDQLLEACVYNLKLEQQ